MQPNRRVNAVVFDMDGTLFDSSEIVPDAYATAVRGLSGATVTREEVIAAYPVGPPAVLLAHLIGRAVEPLEVATYHRALRSGAAGLGVYPGIREALEAMSSHVPLGVFTGADREACSNLLEATGLARLF